MIHDLRLGYVYRRKNAISVLAPVLQAQDVEALPSGDAEPEAEAETE